MIAVPSSPLQKAGLKNFSGLEVGRIYDIEVPGACVKSCTDQNKIGVRNNVEVRSAMPLKCTLSTTSWPLRAEYDFIDWEALDQKANSTCVDVMGRVLSQPVLDHNSIIPNKKVELCFKDMRLTVSLL